MVQARSQVCSLLWKTGHVLGMVWGECSNKGGKVRFGGCECPVQVIGLPGETLCQVGQECLVEGGSPLIANDASQTCFGLASFWIACHYYECDFRHMPSSLSDYPTSTVT